MNEHHELLILKRLEGTISASEQQVLNAWMAESDENKKLVNDFEWMWKTSKAEGKEVNFHTAEEWKKFEKAIADVPVEKTKEIKFYSYANAWKIAASIAVIAVFSWVLYSVVFSHETILKESGDAIVQVTLPDGSEVWLNRNSRLAYHDNFNKKSRTVLLRGEAFFEVKPDREKPFIVQTTEARVKVLGTSFNVQATAESGSTEVVVVTGLVNFSSLKKDEGINLKPGQGAIAQKNTVVMLEDEETNAMAWKNKKLIFKKSSLERVVENLESYFKVDIDIQNEAVTHCRFTGSFDQPTLEEIIEALSVSLDLTIVKKDDVYIVDGDGC